MIQRWTAIMAEHEHNADMARDPSVKRAYLDLVEGYRRLIDSELTTQALFASLAGRKAK